MKRQSIRVLFTFVIVFVLTSGAYFAVLAVQEPDRFQVMRWFNGEADPASVTEGMRASRLYPEEVPMLVQLNNEYASIVDHVLPAVVSVDTIEQTVEDVVTRPFQLPTGEMKTGYFTRDGQFLGLRGEDVDRDPDKALLPMPGVGSGVFISADGRILTNHHVIQNAVRIMVTTHEGERLEAELVGTDSTVDLAVLQVKNPGDRTFPVLSFANSDQVRVGEIVMAVGTPFGLAESVTQGIVCATRRRSVGTNEYIQTNAEINPGSSGGPLVNIFGEVVGINVNVYAGDRRIQSWQGIGMALPANRVLRSYEDLQSLGSRTRPFLGVLFNEVSPYGAERAGLSEVRGALIANVNRDSPASRAKLRNGDIVLRAAGKDVKDTSHLAGIIQEHPITEPMEMTIRRGGEDLDVAVELDSFNDVNQIVVMPGLLAMIDAPEELRELLGMRVIQFTAEDIRATGLPADLGGILIEDIQQESLLSGHILPLDVVHSVNGVPIWTEDDFYEQMGKLPDNEDSTVVLTRRERRYYLELRPVRA